jgi:hypothetical protein
MAALAGIGDVPDSITDRAVNINLQRRAPNDTELQRELNDARAEMEKT